MKVKVGIFSFSQFCSLVTNILLTSMQGLKVKCGTCENFVAVSYMYQHYHRFHEGKKNFHTCNKCGKQYPEKKRLQNHKESVHPENNLLLEGQSTPVPIRSLMCDKCDKMFFHEEGLQEHGKRQHREDATKHACKTCGKTFKNNRIFTQHTSKYHKSIVCEECPTGAGKKFGSKTALRKHELSKHPKDKEGHQGNS